MYTISQTNKMPVMELKTYTKFVAAVFCVSCGTAFSMALLRVIKPELYYTEPLQGRNIAVHFVISGLLLAASALGFFNSMLTLQRRPSENTGRVITRWLLLESVFESARVVYVFVCEVCLGGSGMLQGYELGASAAQYLLDSCLYCQMILRH